VQLKHVRARCNSWLFISCQRWGIDGTQRGHRPQPATSNVDRDYTPQYMR
jgi:hypothetical protein